MPAFNEQMELTVGEMVTYLLILPLLIKLHGHDVMDQLSQVDRAAREAGVAMPLGTLVPAEAVNRIQSDRAAAIQVRTEYLREHAATILRILDDAGEDPRGDWR